MQTPPVRRQNTVARAWVQTGIGLHSGRDVSVCLLPAAANAGRYFLRTDLPGAPVIPARVAAVSQTQLSTELGAGEARVRTVEHLLAALVSHNIDNVCMEIDGPEVPLLDGSARGWCAAIAAAGRQAQPEAPAPAPLTLKNPIWLQDEHGGDAAIAAFPSPATHLSYGIDFPTAAIGLQWGSWDPKSAEFTQAIAPARTFALANQIESLRQAGLIKGGSLENALVCDENGWLNPPLRFANEPARHKLLDLVGDLSLLGVLPQVRVLAYKASHRLHVRLARALIEAQT
ncbi:MAG: UDP-3-O-acyl-N-acetylglucosamine deacetylase [Cyanobacteria bacterium J06641_5]